MPKFTFVCDHSCDLDTHVVTHQFKAETLTEVLENLEMFLRGAGYYLDGTLDIVDYTKTDIPSPAVETHSDHFYDITRNR